MTQSSTNTPSHNALTESNVQSVVHRLSVTAPVNELTEATTFIDELNQAICPPKPLSASDVYVRAMLLVSDERNQHGGKFPLEELQRVSKLVIDAPVLVGHRKDHLPIARIFKAEMVTQNGVNWVKAYLYWLKETAGAETLRANIDGGVCKDCSLGFTFEQAECSICKADIRACGHNSLATSESKVTYETPCYYYRNVQRALEISLVYRGANPGAKVGADLESTTQTNITSASSISEANWLAELSIDRLVQAPDRKTTNSSQIELSRSSGPMALTYPLLDGLPLLVGRRSGQTIVLLDNGAPAPKRLSTLVTALCNFGECDILGAPESNIDSDGDRDFLLYARIVGMRGKSKRSSRELLKFLADDSGRVRSLRIRALALLRFDDQWLNAENATDFQETLRTICHSQKGLCSVQHLNMRSTSVASTDTEILSIPADGQFRLLRNHKQPVIHAQVTSAKTVAVILATENSANGVTTKESVTVSLELPKHIQRDDIVGLAFDRLAQEGKTFKLINPRVTNRFGAYHSEETLLRSNSNATFIISESRLRDGVIVLQPSDSPIGQIDELSAGLTVTVDSTVDARRARLISLRTKTRDYTGLLLTDNSSQGTVHE